MVTSQALPFVIASGVAFAAAVHFLPHDHRLVLKAVSAVPAA
ncbi:hypothetical protein ACIQB5_46450 [Streptomyces sp. NPDC088560]